MSRAKGEEAREKCRRQSIRIKEDKEYVQTLADDITQIRSQIIKKVVYG